MRYASTVPQPAVSPPPPETEPVFTRDELVAVTDWSQWTERLLGYALWRAWRHGPAAAAFDLQPGDLVQEAITLWLLGRRTFDQGTTRAFFVFLCGVIDSLISHDREKSTRRGKVYSIAKDGGEEPNGDEVTEGRIPAHEDLEEEILFRDHIHSFIQSLEPELAAYARLFVEDPDSSAADRAAKLATTVTEIRNLDRRLHRAAAHWSTKH